MSPKDRDKFYIFWTIAIFMCLLLAVFVLVYTSASRGGSQSEKADLNTAQESAESPAVEVAEQSPNLASDSLLAQTADKGSDYLNQLIFLGDVTSYDLAYYYAVPTNQVWTTADHTLSLANEATAQIAYPDTSENLTIAQAAARKKPAYIVVTLGHDDISLGKDVFKKKYGDLISSIWSASPSTVVICQSIFPVIDNLAGSVTNARISTANAWIIELCDEMGCRYLNTHDALADSSGALQADYSGSDGIQLSVVGCGIVTTYVKTHGYQ